MYDSITALKWVQRYIHHFGGDKERVTVYGHSAGSMMASHLLLSPMAKGLMSGVIGSSGSALACWGTAAHPSIDVHLKIANYSGCYDGTSTPDKPAIVSCMQSANVRALLDALSRVSVRN
jgi:carboxylesterase type B